MKTNQIREPDAYCHSCEKDLFYFSEVADPSSPRFDQPCCPYCGSTRIAINHSVVAPNAFKEEND